MIITFRVWSSLIQTVSHLGKSYDTEKHGGLKLFVKMIYYLKHVTFYVIILGEDFYSDASQYAFTCITEY